MRFGAGKSPSLGDHERQRRSKPLEQPLLLFQRQGLLLHQGERVHKREPLLNSLGRVRAQNKVAERSIDL